MLETEFNKPLTESIELVDRIYIDETEVYEGQKFQEVKIVYSLVCAIGLLQNAI